MVFRRKLLRTLAAAAILPAAFAATATGGERPGAAGVVRIQSSTGVVRIHDGDSSRRSGGVFSHRMPSQIVYRAQSPEEVLSETENTVQPAAFQQSSGPSACGSACNNGARGCNTGGNANWSAGGCPCGCGRINCRCGRGNNGWNTGTRNGAASNGGNESRGFFGREGCRLFGKHSDGRCRPKFGHGSYDIVYAVNPCYFDKRDGRAYSAQGWGVPMAVPLAPNVEHTYNYGWGIPSSRLTPVSRGGGCRTGCR